MHSTTRRVVAALLCGSLAASPLAVAPLAALAQTPEEMRAQAAQQNARLEELLAELEAGREEVAKLDEQIADLANRSIAIQGQLIDDRTQLSDMVATTYRWGSPGLVDIAMASTTVEEFVSNLYYAQKVSDWQAACVSALEEDKRSLDERMSQIEDARAERTQALANMEAASVELQATISSLLERAATLEAQQRAAEEARLAAIAKQAQASTQRSAQEQDRQDFLQAARQHAEHESLDPEDSRASGQESQKRTAPESGKAEDAPADDAADRTGVPTADKVADKAADKADGSAAATTASPAAETLPDQGHAPSSDSEPVEEPEPAQAADPTPAPDPTTIPSPEPVTEPEVASAPEPEPEPEPEEPTDGVSDLASSWDADWVTCVASAYSIADNTPPGSTSTASGIPLDDSVPTVAMPMSMDPARFYGQMIQIEYEGMTVIATVTDCGGMGGGSRGLDLTPAVFRAFGAQTPEDWGLRTVRYRFL